jgi:hypothetical protein
MTATDIIGEVFFQRLVFGPVVIQPERRTCSTAAISSSPILGRRREEKPDSCAPLGEKSVAVEAKKWIRSQSRRKNVNELLRR